ncbi:MAG: hypothetical protein NVSMB18_03420 [Acetobacteraceae bacterium]
MLGQCLVAEGWASHRDLLLTYCGVEVPASSAHVRRPDLIPIYGEAAAGWGFALCAALPTLELDMAGLKLRLNAGMTLDDPTAPAGWHDDGAYGAMFERFRAAVAARPGRLLEIGARARSGNSYRHLFAAEVDWVGLDIVPGPGVDVVGDAHRLSEVVSGSFDFVFSVSVFEHLLMPWKVALELNKVLVPDGLGLIVSHQAFPLHEEPWDFYRYSREAWRGIFNLHTGFEVLDGQYSYPVSVVPRFAGSRDLQRMSAASGHLLSACLVRRVGAARVAWEANVAEAYDLNYGHS